MCSVRKGVPRNFAKFTGKHLCQSLSLNEAASLRQFTKPLRATASEYLNSTFRYYTEWDIQ